MLTLRLCVSSILAGKRPDLPMPGVPGKKVVSRLPPPPDKEEELPSPRAGVVWSRGYWAFQGGWFVWARRPLGTEPARSCLCRAALDANRQRLAISCCQLAAAVRSHGRAVAG